MRRTSYRTLVVGVFVCAVVGSGLASAAGATTVELSPGDRLVETGETTTVAIEVGTVDNGVGSFDLAVGVANGTVADVASVAVSGSPRFVDREYDADDDEVRVVASGMDTSDSGTVDVVSVTLEKDADGTTDVTLSVSALGDESGDDYDVTDTGGATIHQHVATETPTDTATATPTETATATPTSPPSGNTADDSSDGNSAGDSDGNLIDIFVADSKTSTATPTPTTTTTTTTTTQTPTDTPTDTTTVATTETTVTSEPMSTVAVSSNFDTPTTTVVNTTTPVETSGFTMWPGVMAGLAVVLAIGGYAALREDESGYDNLLE
jgi:hypothetical protein